MAKYAIDFNQSPHSVHIVRYSTMQEDEISNSDILSSVPRSIQITRKTKQKGKSNWRVEKRLEKEKVDQLYIE